MSDLKDYIKTPYILDESELGAKPINDVLELVKHIEETVSVMVDDLSIHSENLKLIHRFVDKHKKVS